MRSEMWAVWLTLMALFSTIVGASAGLLAWAGGNNPPASILVGGGAFAGAFALLLAIHHYATSGAKVP